MFFLFFNCTADYGEISPPAVLIFTSTQMVDCVDIQIVDDNLVEGAINEFFSVSLGTNDFQVVLDTNLDSANVFIQDNDSMFHTIGICTLVL